VAETFPSDVLHSLRAPPDRCLFNRGNRDGPVPGCGPQVSRSTPSRSRDARGVSSFEHESVYKFMIMTTLLPSTYIHNLPHSSSLSSSSPPPPPPVPARALWRFTLSAFSLSPHCVRRDDDPILHLYSTVRDSSQSRSARVPRSVLPNRQNEPS